MNSYHFIITGIEDNSSHVSAIHKLLRSNPASLSIFLNDEKIRETFSKEKSVAIIETLEDVKINDSGDDNAEKIIITDILNLDNCINETSNFNKQDHDIAILQSASGNESVFIKNFLFKSINWNKNVNPIEDIITFFRKNYIECTNYKIHILDTEKNNIELKNYLNLSLAGHHILRLKSALNPSFSTDEIFLRREKHVFAEPLFFRSLFVAISIVLFFLFPILSFDAGISGDEDKHVDQAQKVYSYFQTHGEDTSYMTSPHGPFYAYNITFDVVLHVLIQKLNIENVYDFRHFVNSFTGYFAVLFCGLLVTFLAGWRAGVIALILLFFSPRFLGHSLNNPKDIPFALGYVFSIYYMFKFVKTLPRISIKDSILIALGIGFTLNIRIGGLLLIAILFLFAALHTLSNFKLKELFKAKLPYVGKLIAVLAGICVVGYVIGFIFWPYGLEDPLKNPLESLKNMTNFKISLKQTFEGEVIWSDNVPWYYTVKYMLITIPLIVLIGLTVSIFTFLPLSRKYGWLNIFMVFFTFLFPLIYIIIRESNVYGGWRHMNFSYVIIVGLAATGLNHLFYYFRNKNIKYAVYGLITILLLHPVAHIIKNHPYQYIYFNQLAGGINGAYGNYEMDYYYHSLKESSNWLINNEIDTTANKKTIVATNHAEIVKYYFREYTDHVTVTYVRFYDRGNYNWDYAVIANSYINPYQQKNGYWPPANTIHEIKVNKAVVGAVIERKDKNDHLGYQAMKEKNYFKAEVHLKKALEANPNNEVARINLAKLYIDQNRLNEANGIVNGTLKIYHNYDKALNLLGIIYLKKREFNNALGVFNRITQVNPKFVNAYHNIGVVLLNQKKNQQALDYFQKALKVNSKYKPSYMAIAHILRQAGKEEEAQRYVDAANKL